MTEGACGACKHPGHWRACSSPGCYCRRRGPQPLCSEGACGLPATKDGLCAGHNRLMEYHPLNATNE